MRFNIGTYDIVLKVTPMKEQLIKSFENKLDKAKDPIVRKAIELKLSQLKGNKIVEK